MATFRITAPDGNTYEITAPDDASEEDVLSYAQQNYQSAAKSGPDFSDVQTKVTTGRNTASKPAAPQDRQGSMRGWMDRSGISDYLNMQSAARHALGSQLHGAADLVQTGLTNAAEYAAENFPSSIAQGLASSARNALESDRAAMAARESEYQSARQGGFAATAGEIAGTALPYAIGAPARAGTSLLTRLAPAGSGLARRTAAASVVGGTGGAIQGGIAPVSDGDYVQQKIQQAKTGGVAGAIAGPAGEIISASGTRAASAASPKLRELYQKAQAMGVQLTPAQLTDSGFVRRLSLMLDNLPLSGAPSRRAAQQDAGNRELARILGENAETVDPVVMSQAADRIGDQFDNVFSDGMRYDQTFLRRIAELKRDANRQMDETAVRTMNNFVERIRNQSQDGKISGRTLQSLDQAARKAAVGGGDRQMIAQEFRDALHSAFDRQAPEGVKTAWDTARRQWAALKTVEPLVSRNAMGGVPLQQLQGAINSTQKGRTLRARGRDGDLGTLATIGQRIKPPSSSGTGENLQAAGMGAGAIANLPLTLATLGIGGLGGRALSSRGLADFMMRSNAGNFRRGTGDLLRRPVVAPAVVEQDKNKPKRNR